MKRWHKWQQFFKIQDGGNHFPFRKQTAYNSATRYTLACDS